MEVKTISQHTLNTITIEQAWKYSVIPFESSSNEMSLYVSQSKTEYPRIKEELELITGKDIVLHEMNEGELIKMLSTYYRKGSSSLSTKNDNINIDSEDFLNTLIFEANSLGSSDIHIETYQDDCRIRYRIDGKLIERYNIDRLQYPALINKIKIKANLDIAEKRLPQDGRIFFKKNNLKFDIRVSVLPVLTGEKIVLRLLSRDASLILLENIGFDDKQLVEYSNSLNRTSGIILISGPTGSGKTTTLYATLNKLNLTSLNILTIEDPIEYTLNGINQVQLKESIGLSFAQALKTFLRQDPDIIMLGEIRDTETAQMSIRAALTGHLVLSTIHTNSAWGIVNRLIDMGIPPFLLADSLNILVAQRLVRLLCEDCKKLEALNKKELLQNLKDNSTPEIHYVSVGCPKCYFTGYRGRKAIFEIIPVDNKISDLIKSKESNTSSIYKSQNIESLYHQAFRMFVEGKTSLEEVLPYILNQNEM